MTDKQIEWRWSLATCYMAIGGLSVVFAILRANSGVVFWQLLYLSVLCSFISTSISGSIRRDLVEKAQQLSQKSLAGWQQANALLKLQEDHIKELTALLSKDDDTPGT